MPSDYGTANCETSHLQSSGARATPLWACGATPCGGFRPSDSFLSRSEELDHAEGAPTRFMIASGGVLSEGFAHGGPGICLGDGQTETEGVPSQGERSDALLRLMPPYLTWTVNELITYNGLFLDMYG